MLAGWKRKLWEMESAGCDPMDVYDVWERVQTAERNLRWATRVVLRGEL
jgi:hypothetical protein